LLAGWDFQAHKDSAPAALFQVFWKNLLFATCNDQLPKDFWPGGGSRWIENIRNFVKDRNNPWWDDVNTPNQVETREDMMRVAFAAAVDEIEALLGKDPEKWRWGDLHTTTFRNATLGESGVAPIEAIFNRGAFPTSGGESIVNATGWTATSDNPYVVDWVPSMRMIVDLGNLQNSLAVHTTGQSGHAYHIHYADMPDLWRNSQYHPMHWVRSVIEAEAEGHLRLYP
jgi:penicillin amidase